MSWQNNGHLLRRGFDGGPEWEREAAGTHGFHARPSGATMSLRPSACKAGH
jgi:hypothetical protein